jgi:hypothetical protein
MSDLEESKAKAIDAVSKISATLVGLDLDYGEAMAAMSAALILSALNMGVTKDDFMRITELEWDSIAKQYDEEETTH